jgi:serine/threonine-protein kinase HipA
MSVIFERTLYVGVDSGGGEPIAPVGILRLARHGVVESGEFAYGQRYLQSPQASALNPNYLPLRSASFALPERRIRDGGALPLTFRDALPDSWGRRLLEAQFGRTLPDIDVLLLTNADRVGAMVFAEQLPIQSELSVTDLISLDELADAVHQLEYSLEITPEMKRLLQRGGTLGGARPKATFIHDKVRWMAKFPARGDEYDVELLEAATLTFARRCGIEVSEFFVQPLHAGNALLLRRFDRQGPLAAERRIHFLSASALLDVPYESSGGSYVEFAQTLRCVSADPVRDLQQLYLRMVFNLVIDNSDDHVKNHGVLFAGNKGYLLSPAFDLVPQLTNIGYQQLAIFPGKFESHIDLAREAAPYFGISQDKANKIIADIICKCEAEFGEILSGLGANRMLVERVRVCLQKQTRLISQ